MRQSKDLGQVFLKNEHFIQKIIESLSAKGKIVLEIGPGEGVLSDKIAQLAEALYCVELDSRFYTLLVQKFRGRSNVTLINGDILKFDIATIPQKPLVFGNVPYHISTDLMHYLIANKNRVTDVYLTLQKEFAEKLTAAPGTDGYSFSTCLLHYHAKIEKLFDIPKSAFSPVPKIDSSFIHIKFFSEPPQKAKDEELLFKIIKNAFSQRRKKIINSLHYLSKDNDFFTDIGINTDWRAENLTLAHYIAIVNHLTP